MQKVRQVPEEHLNKWFDQECDKVLNREKKKMSIFKKIYRRFRN